MVTITAQRNDLKERSDLVSHIEDTININGQEFVFEKGVDLLFQSPHEQIVEPKRDSAGVLHATIVKQYIGTDCKIFETCDTEGNYGGCECESQNMINATFTTRSMPITAEIKKEDLVEKNRQLLREKDQEITKLKAVYLDADLEDDQELKVSSKEKIKIAKAELVEIQKNLDQEIANANK